ncbi:hypothetical protein K0M31_009227 [Melipona bicolor]|uniref:Uncharacterized protein n=1 Tax=Melipona bicolor TaxID=60889 RepID=A0AA40KJJ9_9HYME|nr:hypothetical protein K0M31_009227 [Melipona bicolor]
MTREKKGTKKKKKPKKKKKKKMQKEKDEDEERKEVEENEEEEARVVGANRTRYRGIGRRYGSGGGRACEGGRRWRSGCGDEVGWRLEGPRGARDEGKLVSRMAMAMAESMS